MVTAEEDGGGEVGEHDDRPLLRVRARVRVRVRVRVRARVG